MLIFPAYSLDLCMYGDAIRKRAPDVIIIVNAGLRFDNYNGGGAGAARRPPGVALELTFCARCGGFAAAPGTKEASLGAG
jgi:hypothetical protein